MNNKNATFAVLAIGALIFLASLLADVIGLGDDVGFGRQQTTGVIVGIFILGVGAYLYKKGENGEGGSGDDA